MEEHEDLIGKLFLFRINWWEFWRLRFWKIEISIFECQRIFSNFVKNSFNEIQLNKL